MNTTTTKLLKTCTITAELGTSRYGSPQPQLTVRTPKGTHWRQLRAVLFTLAAEAELATPASEHWIVQIDDAGNEVGYVYIELSGGSDAEAKRGLALLKRIAG
jgi:hypothetical protein